MYSDCQYLIMFGNLCFFFLGEPDDGLSNSPNITCKSKNLVFFFTKRETRGPVFINNLHTHITNNACSLKYLQSSPISVS